MPVDPRKEPLDALRHLTDQIADDSVPALSRLVASVAAVPYFEALTRGLVEQARAEGATWQDIADVFVTSEVNVRARFDSYRRYDDADEDDDAGE